MHYQIIREGQIRERAGHLCVAGPTRRSNRLIRQSIVLTLVLFWVASLAQAADRFVDNHDGTVSDTNTDLIWLKDASCANLFGTDDTGSAEWAGAKTAAAELKDGDCGLSDKSNPLDWRLPTKEEWEAMIAQAVKNGCQMPLITDNAGTGCYSGTSSSFVGVEWKGRYWSATEFSDSNAWSMPLSHGIVRHEPKMFGGFVWPVRSRQSDVKLTGQTKCYASDGEETPCTGTGQDGEYQYGGAPAVTPARAGLESYDRKTVLAGAHDPGFADNGNGTVTDNLTGLVWLKDASCNDFGDGGQDKWSNALEAARLLASGTCALSDGSVAGQWRLPNINELRSLFDANLEAPNLPANHPFSGVQKSSYWSSTSHAGHSLDAWTVNLRAGKVQEREKSRYDLFVWPVRFETTLPFRAGTTLERGRKFTSASGNHFLVFQDTGNLVIADETPDAGYVWGTNKVIPSTWRSTDRIEFDSTGNLRALDGNGGVLWSAISANPDPTARLDLSFSGALQIVSDTRGILWSSDGDLTQPLDVFSSYGQKASSCTPDQTWTQCLLMSDPQMTVRGTARVSQAAMTAAVNVYHEVTKRLSASGYPKSTLDGYTIYITNGESEAELNALSPLDTLFGEKGYGLKSRAILRGGASNDALWISEQMICKRGVKSIEDDIAAGRTPPEVEQKYEPVGRTHLRTLDQVVHEFGHTIHLRYGITTTLENTYGTPLDRETFPIDVQAWFRAPVQEFAAGGEALLGTVFTSRAKFSCDGYRP